MNPSSFFKDFKIKAASVILALFLWFYVVTENKYIYEFNVPIYVKNLQKGKILKNEIPGFSKVKFRGTGKALLKTWVMRSYSEIKIILDLRGISQFYDFSLKDYLALYPNRLVIPRGYDIEFIEVISPDTIKVRLDNYGEKLVHIEPRVKVNTKPGFIVVGKITTDPPSALVSGPESVINGIDTVYTENREYSGSRKRIEEVLALTPHENKMVEFTPENVKIAVDVQSIGEKTIDEIPVQVLNVPENLKAIVSPSRISIVVRGGTEFISHLSENEVSAWIDYNNDWKKGKRFYIPHITVPDDVTQWQDLTPKSVEVIVIRERR